MANELSYGIGRIAGSPDPVSSSAVLTKGTPSHATPTVSGNMLEFSPVIFPAVTASDRYVWFDLPAGASLRSAMSYDGSFGYGTTGWLRIGSTQTYVFNRRLNVGIVVQMTFETTAPANPSATNHPPRVSTRIGNYRLTVGTPQVLNLDDYFTDPDGDALTYQAQSSSAGLASALVTGNTLTVTPLFAGGPVTITVTATDPRGEQASDTFAVDVIGQSAGNRPPHPTGTIPNVSVNVGDDGATSTAGYFQDYDHNIDAWSATTSDANIIRIVSASHGIVNYHGVSPGTAHITVFAHYGNLQVSQSFQVTVEAVAHTVTHQPVVLSPIVIPELTPGETFVVSNVSSHFEDLDGTTPHLHLVSDYNRDVIRVTLDTSTDALTVHAGQVGSTEIKIVARDDAGESVQTQVYVEVHKAASQHPSTDVLDKFTQRWLTIDEFIVGIEKVRRTGDDLDNESAEIDDDQRRKFALSYLSTKRIIDEEFHNAPYEIKNQALIRCGGYMANKTLNPGPGERAERNFLYWSGAWAMLWPYRPPKVALAVGV